MTEANKGLVYYQPSVIFLNSENSRPIISSLRKFLPLIKFPL